MKTVKVFAAIIAILFSSISFAQKVSLGNRVWWDTNNNGQQDPNEPLSANILVTLYQDNDDNGIADAGFTPLTTYTNGNGLYAFEDLDPGKYFITIDAGLGHYISTVYGGDPDNDTNKDNNGFSQDPNTGIAKTETITLAPGTEPNGIITNSDRNNTLDIGMFKGNGLGDDVWLDSNADGVRNTGEPGLANVTVKLMALSGYVLETTVTDSNGHYFFYDPYQYSGITQYAVQFVTPAGYVPTSPNIGSNDDIDSDPVNGFVSLVVVPNGSWDKTIDAGFIYAGGPLPITLSSFNAKLIDSKVLLEWTTENETNTSHFEIERSTDGKQFNNIGLVFAYGNSNMKRNYSFTDSVLNNQQPVIYYRLVTYFNDGRKEISDNRIVKTYKQTSPSISINVYPNPVVSQLQVKVPNNWQNKKVLYQVLQLDGKVIKSIESINNNGITPIQVNTLTDGVYLLKANANGETAIQKFIKQ